MQNNSGLVRKSATGLHFQQSAGQHTISAADGNGLVTLQLCQLTTLLTGDISGVLSIGNSSILQLIQSKQILTNHVQSGNSFEAGDSDIVNIHNTFLLFYL